MEIRPHYEIIWPKKRASRTPKRLAKPEAAPLAKKIQKKARAKPAEKPKKTPRQLKTAKQRARKEKAEQRENRLQGKLLEQLTMLDQRIQRMDRDNERYCLIGMSEEGGAFSFTIMKDEDVTKVTIHVGADGVASCSCMDWRTRCAGMAIACKHLYYLLTKILTYELFDFYDNTLTDHKRFVELVRRRIKLNEQNYRVKQNDRFEGEMCSICYHEFKANDQAHLVKCPDCRYFFHRGCMNVWLLNSKRRNCVVCRSESWATFNTKIN